MLVMLVMLTPCPCHLGATRCTKNATCYLIKCAFSDMHTAYHVGSQLGS
jgi:hypothetical protein